MDVSAQFPPLVYGEEARLADLRAAELLVVMSTRLHIQPRPAASPARDLP